MSEDPAALVADECHIVARSPGGPRAGSTGNLDSEDNLILLCRVDHKRVDDQPQYFTVERLRAIKLAHETWLLGGAGRRRAEAGARGYPDRGLPDITLRWMAERAAEAGLELGGNLTSIKGNASAKLINSMKPMFKVLGPCRSRATMISGSSLCVFYEKAFLVKGQRGGPAGLWPALAPVRSSIRTLDCTPLAGC